VEKVVITNAFSLSMIEEKAKAYKIKVKEIEEEKVKELELDSAVGHESTADLLTKRLGKEVKFNRVSIKLGIGSQIVVAQLMGPRKECREMTSSEIEKYPIKYLSVEIEAEKGGD
jgi:hypothetical protein